MEGLIKNKNKNLKREFHGYSWFKLYVKESMALLNKNLNDPIGTTIIVYPKRNQ